MRNLFVHYLLRIEYKETTHISVRGSNVKVIYVQNTTDFYFRPVIRSAVSS